MSYLKNVNTNKTDLGYDAWGQNVTIQNRSIFSSLFQIDVPNKLWEEAIITGDYYDHLGHTHLISTGVNAKSIEGALLITSGLINTQGSLLVSKRSPQYQPNRGHKFSSSNIIPNPNNNGFAEFGWIGHDNNLFIRVKGNGTTHTVEVCVIRNGIFTQEIDITSYMPNGYDLSKGNLWDIQMQWRGVGDFKIYFNQSLIYTVENLGNLTSVSISNPSMPLGFRCVNTGDEYTQICGCVDLTSEGGRDQQRIPLFLTTGTDYLLTEDGIDTAMIALRIPRHLDYNGGEIHSSRDCVVHSISGFCRDEYALSIHFGRDTNLPILSNSLEWNNTPDSIIQSMILGANTVGNTEFQSEINLMSRLATYHNDVDSHTHIVNEAEPNGNFFITSGDILILSIKSTVGEDNSAASITLSEEL